MTTEPTVEDIADIKRLHPGWYGWVGVTGVLYARWPLTSPPVIVRADDPAELHRLVEDADDELRSRWR